MKRLDLFLVESGMAPTRSKAQQMIRSGEVEIEHQGGWRVENSPAFQVDEQAKDQVRVRDDAQTLKFVSRGGLKLESALKHLNLEVHHWRCLDVGQSTGGFTDALLKSGASCVTGLDVGHDQLHSSLRDDPRVTAFEGLHIRELRTHKGLKEKIAQGVDLAVVDVSFISLAHVLPELAEALPPGSRLLALVKPQFEVGPQGLGKGGVVTDVGLFDDVKSRVLLDLEKCGFKWKDYFPCAVRGQDGNQEFFVYAIRD